MTAVQEAIIELLNKVNAQRDAIASLDAQIVAAEALCEFMLTARDYVEDASKGMLLYRGRSMLVEMATEDLAKIDEVLAKFRAAREARL